MRWLHNFSGLEEQLARWVEQLANFQYKIIHRAGKQHANVDALFRLPGVESGNTREQGAISTEPSEPVIVVRAMRNADVTERPRGGVGESENELVQLQ